MLLLLTIKDFAWPVMAAILMAYFVYYVWRWVTLEMDPVLGATMVSLIKLVDSVRLLDNELIRMKMKIDTVLELRNQNHKK